ncbi:MAG: CoA transferase [Deltaproteobacteria bacterium]|nr:CoA transferase [Deltaproteobacteria bacterium]MBW2136311.1 CoA transferase [Deltaproteobacteria bacterium]
MKTEPGINRLLEPFEVLDLTDEKGSFCPYILSHLGASVTRLESREPKRDFWWWAYDSQKKRLEVDIEREQDKALSLVRRADFLVESFPPGHMDRIGLGYSALKELNPRLIYTSITPYGQTGPYKDYKASDLEIMAMSGVMYVLGDPDRPPVRISFPQSYLLTSAIAAVGTLIAHHWRETTGQGQHVDVSAQESLYDVLMQAPYYYKWFGNDPARTGPYRLGVSGGIFLHPMIWKCRDGHVAYMMQGGKLGAYSNSTLARYIEEEGILPDHVRQIRWEELDMAQMTQEKMEEIWKPFADFFLRHTVEEIYRIALKERIQLFPVNTVRDIIHDEQLEAREYWVFKDIRELGKELKFPGRLAKLSFPDQGGESGERAGPNESPERPPFEGLKIADFSWVAAGPWVTTWLEGYGAEVVKVESINRLDATRVSGPYLDNRPGPDRSGMFLVFNGAKKSLTLNLNTPGGREIARKLVKWADVVVESFAPGQMRRWGLNYEELCKLNPKLIMLSASMMGATGPHAEQPGLGLQLTSLAGFTYLTGWPDRDPPYIWGAYTDIPASRIGASALLAVLDYYRRSGKPCYIDLSQYEASLHFLSPLILEFQATGNPGNRMGNRSPIASPHGVFPCKGKDRWCAISVFSEEEWQALCQAMGTPETATNTLFSTFEKRKENEDALEDLIASWTRGRPPEDVMTLLQDAGVNAGVVKTSGDLFADPQFKHRRHFIPVSHPEVGDYEYFCPGFRLAKVPIRAGRAPCLGEHNEYVCTKILGLTDDEFIEYLTSGALE